MNALFNLEISSIDGSVLDVAMHRCGDHLVTLVPTNTTYTAFRALVTNELGCEVWMSEPVVSEADQVTAVIQGQGIAACSVEIRKCERSGRSRRKAIKAMQQRLTDKLIAEQAATHDYMMVRIHATPIMVAFRKAFMS